ncbi:MAG: aldehyde dehydrogenase family protein [Rhizomicrobium sp.]
MSVRDIAHFINGSLVAGASGRHSDVFNPATGAVSGRVPLASRTEVDAAVDAAAAAFPQWAATPPHIRARVLFRFRDLVETNADEFGPDDHGRARQGVLRRQGVS